jgi:AraC-like DNA-binding protein
MTQSYVEHAPRPELAGLVRTVWIQRAGGTPYLQRHLPTGGAEIHMPIGGPIDGPPRLAGPLTGPDIEVIPPRTTLVGIRFQPGTPLPFPIALYELVDRRVGLSEVWERPADQLAEAMASAPGPEAALDELQADLVQAYRSAGRADPLVRQAVRLLMPWQPAEIGTLATRLGISGSQLRRRCLHTVGVGPKALQRTLRFQGFLALAQARATLGSRRGSHGMAGLAAEAGYADQAHLTRECRRLTGLSPHGLLGGDADLCGSGHDHSASYRPFLAARRVPAWQR